MTKALFNHDMRPTTILAMTVASLTLAAPAQAGPLDGLKKAVEAKVKSTAREKLDVPDIGSANRSGGEAEVAAAGGKRGLGEAPASDAHHVDWDTKFTATGLADRHKTGHSFKFYCPPAPDRLTPRRFSGIDRYAFHTLICRAAVHAGKIDFGGGNVTLRMEAGSVKLKGSTRNGITTKPGSSGIRTLVFVN
ncbi:LCCL domain-containing protein [Sphingorhabdus sp. EL138]|jgi:hypothetical protein|uniref:LCCL domain-containing protein n=1 Tax=Sphingorhabdus sp. EL138 TaxID=2073156 RepID=UPI000D6A025D|nr:LCCL domain-containing protein [Sphingorhabdus sp. EL138]